MQAGAGVSPLAIRCNVAADSDVAFFDRDGGALHIYKGGDYVGCSSFDYNEMFDEPLLNLDEVGSFGFDHVRERIDDVPGRCAYDPATVRDWYADGADNPIECIETADGLTLYNTTDVEQLVQAMAAFAPPAATQTSWTRPQEADGRILLATQH